MNSGKTIKAEVFRGPFDPGGQPEMSRGQPLELSLFAWNVRSGLSATKAVMSDEDRYANYWHWPSAEKLLRRADELGFDNQVQYGMWGGYGGPSRWNDDGLDFATAASASAVVTKNLNLFSTVHVGYKFHPMHIAKIGACIDFVSGGRWGLNVVSGANPEDFRKFGITERPAGPERYAMADEFVTLMKYLWTSDAPVDFEGKYYQCYGGYVGPRPARNPRPILMNAGQSDAGFDFACRQADWVFVVPPKGFLEDYVAMVNKAHTYAAKYERKVHVGAMCYSIIEETDARAEETQAWLEQEADYEAILNYSRAMMGTNSAMDMGEPDQWAGLGEDQYKKVALGMTGFQLFGSPETVAEKLRVLHETGIDNAVVGFFDPHKAVPMMGEKVMPILKKMGLRN
ncbi:MAG: flavin-dependent oxidoreductase [Rhodospirillaceae bacterium]|nr:flavin-dependent oxidoreductase [Rhodospirillaceae bacterium]